MKDNRSTPHEVSEDHEPSDAELAELDAVRALVQRTLTTPPRDTPTNARTSDALVEAVQKTLRERSGGKFYGDGWSTTPKTRAYLFVALAMLVTVTLVYVLLGPVALRTP
jgi:hypothetical protein